MWKQPLRVSRFYWYNYQCFIIRLNGCTSLSRPLPLASLNISTWIYINPSPRYTEPYLREYSSRELEHTRCALALALRADGYRSWLLSWGLRARVCVFSSGACSWGNEGIRSGEIGGPRKETHKQDRTNGCKFKNGTTGAFVGHYFPRGWMRNSRADPCKILPTVCLSRSLFSISALV